MSEPQSGTREQTPDDLRRIGPVPIFAPGDAVPGLNSWVLERKLGGGGFGAVWLARHAFDAEQRPRAVKFCTDPTARHRLVTHERNVVLRVMKYAGKHPNIVPLLEYNLDGAVPWLMYEYVEGGTLAGLIEQWQELPLPKRLGRAVKVLHAIAGALAACHRLDPPLVHRDMKPHNVLMAGTVPRITDFGIGSVAFEVGVETGALTALAARIPTALQGAGTRLYAPPEQRFGGAPSPREDVYALGIIAYQFVTGDLASIPGTDAALELHEWNVPDELAALIVRSVSMNPERRPAAASEWATGLEATASSHAEQLASDTGSPIAPPLLSGATAACPTESLALLTEAGLPRSSTEPLSLRDQARGDEPNFKLRLFLLALYLGLFLLVAAAVTHFNRRLSGGAGQQAPAPKLNR